MGGRGSAFKITTGRSHEDWFKDYDTETYTLLPTSNTEKLKNKRNTWVMSTTDDLQRKVMNEQSEFLRNLSDEYSGSTNLLTKDNNLRIRALPLKSSSTMAAFVFPFDKYNKMQICYNKKFFNQAQNEIYKNSKKNIDSGWHSHSDEENIVNHTIAHEYGHFVERTIVEKYKNNNPEEYSQFSDFETYYKAKSKEICKKIYQIKAEQLGDKTHDRVSEYAYDCYPENFAEIFANLATSKKPTNWGNAMKIFLKEEKIC